MFRLVTEHKVVLSYLPPSTQGQMARGAVIEPGKPFLQPPYVGFVGLSLGEMGLI
jgi:hypothetical protein